MTSHQDNTHQRQTQTQAQTEAGTPAPERTVQTFSPRMAAGLTIVLIIVLFVSVNIIANAWLRTARVDLTENGLFTLSEGTVNTLRKLSEPIRLQLYFSKTVGAEYPVVRTYAKRVQDLLEEYEGRSGGMIDLEVIDPEPFTEEEDLANAHGLRPLQTQTGESIFFGLVGTNAIDGKETIPFFPFDRSAFLEYDLTEMVHRLNGVSKPVLGILTSLPFETGTGGLQAAMQGRSQPLLIYEQLRQRFDIEMLQETLTEVPASIETLMIAHPGELSEEALYAIDQFVLRGGRAMVFVDPQSGLATPAMGPMGQPTPGGPAESSDLATLFAKWGVGYSTDEVVADALAAQVVGTTYQGRPAQASYLIWLGLDAERLSSDDLVTADIELLNLATAGHLQALDGAETEIQPLVVSSNEAMLLGRMEVSLQPQPQDLLRKFVPTGETYALAVRVSGPADTAFPDGRPESSAEDGDETAPATQDRPHLARAEDGINVVVVADSDLFDDRFWVAEQNLLGQRIAVPTADNANFVINIAENLMGSNDLISLRSRASGERPFTLVEALRRRAEARYLNEEEALARQLEETERQLAELQGRGQVGETGDPSVDSALLTPEQQQLVTLFSEQLVDTRRKLRDVQRSLRSEIDALGVRLQIFNIALMPLIVAGLAFGLAWYRGRRRAERLKGAARP